MGNDKKRIAPYRIPHPGEVLREVIGGLTVTEVSARLHVSRVTVSKILNCRSAITAEMSLRLAAAFGGSKTFWLEMQSRYDVQKAMEKKLPRIVPFRKAA
ncbi:MAG: HigA family addiction module antitoxin [Terracidiphilus sp.]|jgi:addiction module HigA family antidote